MTSTIVPPADAPAGGRQSLFGGRRPRIEDDRLLAGRGRYVADIRLPGMVDVAFVRSEIAHGELRAIDTAAAMASPGVLTVATAADMADMSAVPDLVTWAKAAEVFPLCQDRVRYVGAPIAAVVASDRYLAEDAAELVGVDFDPLPVVANVDEGLASDAPQLFAQWGDNRMIDVRVQRPDIDEMFERLQTVGGRYHVKRQAAMPMETRGVVAEWTDGRLTVWSSTQLPYMLRGMLSMVLHVPERDIRVVAPDVGGAFGGKLQVYPEEYILPWLAIHLGRPVRWIEDRYEHMVASCHARDMRIDLEAAIQPDGAIQAIRGQIVQDLGSGELWPGGYGPSFTAWGQLTGPYRIEHQNVDIVGVVTNKTPAGAYRGYGFPEAAFAMERLIEDIAHTVDVSPLDLRRRMMLRPDDLPYLTASGARIDSGSHRVAFERCVELAQVAREEERLRHAGRSELRIGMGLATWIEGTVGTFHGATGAWAAQDACDIRFHPDGGVTVAVGTSTTGQGVPTMICTIAAELLSVPMDDVRVVIGDTDRTPYGLGGHSSRSTGVMAGSIQKAADELTEKATAIAAHLLGAIPEHVELVDGRFAIRGDDSRSLGWRDVAQVALIHTRNLPPGMPPGLDSRITYEPPAIEHVPDANGRANAFSTYANATHAAIVSVDVGTGIVRVLRYIEVHDAGRVINPVVVEGQMHGGIVQGIGGALLEELPFAEDGTPLATSFMAYLPPSASDAPVIESHSFESLAPEMPLGVKGVGETGIVGPGPSIATAIEDALEEFGVRRFSATPITPMDVLERLEEV
jgi:carbon-monoxide dehydrogenase large subunit